jgi:hypothetical protein
MPGSKVELKILQVIIGQDGQYKTPTKPQPTPQQQQSEAPTSHQEPPSEKKLEVYTHEEVIGVLK